MASPRIYIYHMHASTCDHNLNCAKLATMTTVDRRKRTGWARRRARRERKIREPKEVLVGVRVPESFHRRIQKECSRRDMSLKDLVMVALKLYFPTPVEDWDYVNATYFTFDKEDLAAEDQAWTDIWSKFLGRMPREKVELVVKAMEWDLEMQKSSRRKPAKRVAKPSHPGGTS